MAVSDTSICNLALLRLGGKRINNLTDGTVEARYCNLLYEPTRDALLRAHTWRFAIKRADLSVHTDDPTNEYDHKYELPNDFLRLMNVGIEDNVHTINRTYSYSPEGRYILSDRDDMSIRYVAKITDESEFDPLFVEVFALKLAIALAAALRMDKGVIDRLQEEYRELWRRVLAIDRQETNGIGTSDQALWTDARWA